MDTKKYRWLLYLIAFTIALTIGIQIYWNQKNYSQNEQRVFNEIQISLDNAVERYYTQIAKTTDMSYLDHLSDRIDLTKGLDTLFVLVDSAQMKSNMTLQEQQVKFKMQHFIIGSDSINDNDEHLEIEVNDKMKGFISSLVLSMRKHTLNLEKLKEQLGKELKRKNIVAPFGFIHHQNDSIKHRLNTEIETKTGSINMFSKSTFLKANEQLQLFIENPVSEVLKRSLNGILLSFALSLLVIVLLLSLIHI